MERNSLPVVSPYLIYQGDYSKPAPKGFERIFMHSFNDIPIEDKKPDADEIGKFKDWLLIQASQMHEKSRAKNAREEAIDKLLLAASQEVESQLAKYPQDELESHTKSGSSMEGLIENKCTSARFLVLAKLTWCEH